MNVLIVEYLACINCLAPDIFNLRPFFLHQLSSPRIYQFHYFHEKYLVQRTWQRRNKETGTAQNAMNNEHSPNACIKSLWLHKAVKHLRFPLLFTKTL